MQKPDDSLLIAQLKDGNKYAFEKLYEKYSGKLYNSISLLLYNKNTAKDITQNCFLIIWEKRISLDPDKSFPSYLYTIARNLVYKETERQVLNNKFVESTIHSAEILEDNTIEDLNNTYIESYLKKLVNELSPVPKEIFLLKQEKELSTKEIASKMDLTERSVEAHLYRTMKFLKEKLRDYMAIFLI